MGLGLMGASVEGGDLQLPRVDPGSFQGNLPHCNALFVGDSLMTVGVRK